MLPPMFLPFLVNDRGQFFGPDAKETITLEVPDYCNHCQYWFKGPGSIPRR